MPDATGVTHHVKIAGNYYLVRPGSYQKRPAPLFGARFTTGDPDYNNLSFWQHWAQTCWVGGFGAERWIDDAMFDEGIGVDTSQHEVMVLARDMGPSGAARGTQNWDLNLEARIRIFTVFNDKLYALQVGDATTSRLYRFDQATPAWTLIKTFTEAVSWMEVFAGYLVFGDAGTTMNRMTTAEVFSTFNKPAGRTETAYTLKAYRGLLYVGFGRYIYRLKTDFTWDGSTAFYEATDVNYLNQSEVHLGFLYFASRNGHILRTDGNNTFDLWAFEPSTVIWSIRSFDGRLFVGATEELAGTTSAQTVLYQFSGAAVTELKRWGKVGADITPGKLRAFGGSLWFGASSMLGNGNGVGFGIARYDKAEDAYHIWSSNQDGTSYGAGTEQVNWNVDDVFFYKGYVYASVRGHGIFRTPFSYKDVTRFQATYDTTASGASPGSLNGGWYTSSDFDAGTPGLRKMWNAIVVHVDLPTTDCSVYVEYSVDGGQTWVAVGSVTKTNGLMTRYNKSFRLSVAGGALTSTRFKYRLTLRTTNSTVSPQLRGVIVRYLPIPEPNWQWSMRLVLSESQELLDGTTRELNTAQLQAKVDAIESAFRAQSLVTFEDIDQISWDVGGVGTTLITDLTVIRNLPTAVGDGAQECEIALTLVEGLTQYT